MKTITIERFAVGHSASEFYIRLGDENLVILPPAAAKKLALELEKLQLPPDHSSANPLVPSKVIKSLYKSRKVNKSLVSINTRRRKKLPDRS